MANEDRMHVLIVDDNRLTVRLTAVEAWTGGTGPSDDRAVLAIERRLSG